MRNLRIVIRVASLTLLTAAIAAVGISPASATVPTNGTYSCATGLASNTAPTFTISSGVVTSGGSCSGAVVIPQGDDKWGTHKKKLADTYDFLCKNANLVTTSTSSLANIIHRHTGKHAYVISDPAERERKEPEIRIITDDTIIKFAYYGAGKNFEVIKWDKIVNDLKTVHKKIEIHAVVGRVEKKLSKVKHLIEQKIFFAYQWTYELQDQIVDDCHFIILPIVNVNENISAKSPNRLIDGIQRGKLVLTNIGVNSYEPFRNFSYFVSNFNYGQGLEYAINNRNEALRNIKAGQLYIDQHHTPEVIGKKWIEIERLV